eukprot:2290351-Rhodomonas_salina.2
MGVWERRAALAGGSGGCGCVVPWAALCGKVELLLPESQQLEHTIEHMLECAIASYAIAVCSSIHHGSTLVSAASAASSLDSLAYAIALLSSICYMRGQYSSSAYDIVACAIAAYTSLASP